MDEIGNSTPGDADKFVESKDEKESATESGTSNPDETEAEASAHNPEAKMTIVFDCEPDQIARSAEEINENTKAFVGKLEPGVFTKLAELPGIEHLYTNFPEGKINRSELVIGGMTTEQLRNELKEKNIRNDDNSTTNPYFQFMLDQTPTLEKPEKIITIRLTVGDLGFTEMPTTDEIYARAEELGLELCPAESGPHQRLIDLEQPFEDQYVIAMKQMAPRGGIPVVFNLFHSGWGLWLGYSIASPDRKWRLDSRFVFRLPEASPDTETPKT